jgi:hypothetical protein
MTEPHGGGLPSWLSFRTLLAAGDPIVLPLGGEADICVFVGEDAQRIGIRIPAASTTPLEPSPLEEVNVRIVTVEGELFVEVSTDRPHLFEQFYGLLGSLLDRLLVERETFSVALHQSLQRWKELLRPVALLTDEQLLGLWGELWALRRLVRAFGSAFAGAWTAARPGEPHDFRFRNVEVEVKTTLSVTPVHIVNGLAQLTASPEHDLFVLSLQVEPAGADAGTALPDRVAEMRQVLPAAERAVFNERLGGMGYSDDKSAFYGRHLQLRNPAKLIRADEIPALTSRTLQDLGRDYELRIRDVHYRLDVSGLGVADGTQEFLEVLPQEAE